MRVVELTAGSWWSGPVLVAETFWERLRGATGRSADTALLIPGRSVHGFALRRPLGVVAIDSDLVVVATALLHPRRVVSVKGATAMLELPVVRVPPPVGTRLSLDVCTATPRRNRLRTSPGQRESSERPVQNSGNADRSV